MSKNIYEIDPETTDTIQVKEFTGLFWWTEQEAIEKSNFLTKKYGIYITSIKGEPIYYPDECWAVTNKYDPTIRELCKSDFEIQTLEN